MMITVAQKRLAQVFTQEQAEILAEVIEESYRDLVKIGDFNELKAVVKELSVEMKSLAEQQKQTSAEVKELAEQQKQTSAEVKSLSAEMKELAEQQKKTWVAIELLVHEGKKMRQELGGLATTVGYRLEDESYKALPHLLQQDFNMQVIGKIKRGYLQSRDNQSLEINILGKLKQQDHEFLLVGEAKSQLSKKYVDEFIRKKLKQLPIEMAVFPVLVTYMTTSPEVEDYAHDKGIALYYSFDF